MNYSLNKDEQHDYKFINWKIDYTYIDDEGNSKTDEIALSDEVALNDLNISFENAPVENSNNNLDYSATITVNGSTDNMYHRMIDLSEPFMRNLDLVKE